MARPDWEDTRRQLIETYRTLNHELRGRSEDVLAADHGGESVNSVLSDMKTNEMQVAKALTLGLTGEVMGDEETGEEPVIGNEPDRESGRLLISQFGTARATTLNTMQSADDEAWERPIDGNKRILDFARELVENDRTNMEKIRRLAGV